MRKPLLCCFDENISQVRACYENVRVRVTPFCSLFRQLASCEGKNIESCVHYNVINYTSSTALEKNYEKQKKMIEFDVQIPT